MSSIQIIDHEGQERRFDLDEGVRYSLGRSKNNQIVIGDMGLSRKHAEIWKDGERWMLADCGSSNGTFVDDRRIAEPVPLSRGTVVRFGSCRLAFDSAMSATAAIRYSDQPMSATGTVMLSVDDIFKDTPGAGRTPAPEEMLVGLRRRFSVVQKATLELLAYEPIETLLGKILDLVFEAVRPDRAALLNRDREGALTCRAFKGGDRSEFSVSRTIAAAVMDNKVSVLTGDAPGDFDDAKSIVLQGIRSVMAVPLWSRDDVIGLIYADSLGGETVFDEEELKLLTMLGNIAAIQIQNARLFDEQLEKQRFEREARSAAEIQRQLLPARDPSIPGYLLTAHNTPCHEVGGDYYDYLPLGHGRYRIIIADVSGHGMGAALIMASLQAQFHARAEVAPGALELNAVINNAICKNSPSSRFVTSFLMDLDLQKHRLHYINAGHAPPPLVITAAGESRRILPGGPPLGLFADQSFETDAVDLSPGDFIFACSDGVTDIMNAEGELFGLERLEKLMCSLAGSSPSRVRAALEKKLMEFSSGSPSPDDLTILVLQRKP